MTHPTNPLVRKRNPAAEYDWGAVANDVHVHFPKVEAALAAFLEENPMWGGEVEKATHPPSISLSLYVKPEASPRAKTIRGQTVWPERLAVIPDDYLDTASTWLSATLQECPGLKVKTDKAQGETLKGLLFYDLKISNLERYRKRS